MQVLSNKFHDYIVQVTDLRSITCLVLAIFKPRKEFYFCAILLFSVKFPSRMFLDSTISPERTLHP